MGHGNISESSEMEWSFIFVFQLQSKDPTRFAVHEPGQYEMGKVNSSFRCLRMSTEMMMYNTSIGVK